MEGLLYLLDLSGQALKQSHEVIKSKDAEIERLRHQLLIAEGREDGTTEAG